MLSLGGNVSNRSARQNDTRNAQCHKEPKETGGHMSGQASQYGDERIPDGGGDTVGWRPLRIYRNIRVIVLT